MAIFKIYFLFFLVIFLLFHSTKSKAPICDKRHCGNSSELFEFPFQLREENQINNAQSDRCGYPGFEVFCKNKKQPLITLLNGREFVVKHIFHERQRILVEDINGCKPRRFLQNIDIDNDSPFQLDNSYENDHYENVTFLNCTNNVEKEPFDDLPNIPCLSSGTYTIVYTLQSPLTNLWNSSCSEIGFAKVPIRDNYGEPMVINDGLNSDILLQWNTPLCKCEADQSCGFLADTGLYVTCYDTNHYFGHPDGNRTAPKHNIYFFPVVWGISGLLFFVWVTLSVFKDRQQNNIPQSQTILNIEPSEREPPWFVFGLDHSRIEQYPKIQLAESGQLPKSIDSVCSICLSEYKPMETLRSIPQCNHHFHADCIDVWLKMNATCPLCRNLPE